MLSGGRAVGATAVAATGATSLPLLLAGTLSPFVARDVGLGDAVLGAAAAAGFVSSAVFGPAAGALLGLRGARIGIGVAGLLGVVSLLLLATAGSAAQVVVALLVGGAAQTFGITSAMVVMTMALGPAARGIAIGANQAATPLAGVAAGTALGLVHGPLDWRWAVGALAAVPAVVAVLPLVVDLGRAAPPRVRAGGLPPAPPPTVAPGMGRFIVGASLCMAGPGALITFFALSAARAGVSTVAAAATFAVGGGLCVAARLVTGALVGRHPARGVRVIVVMAAVATLAYAALASGVPALVVVGGLGGLWAGWGWSAAFFMVLSTRWTSSITTVVGRAQAGLAFGAGVGPLLFGAVAGGVGVGAAWSVIAACSLVGTLLVATAGRARRASDERAIAPCDTSP